MYEFACIGSYLLCLPAPKGNLLSTNFTVSVEFRSAAEITDYIDGQAFFIDYHHFITTSSWIPNELPLHFNSFNIKLYKYWYCDALQIEGSYLAKVKFKKKTQNVIENFLRYGF